MIISVTYVVRNLGVFAPNIFSLILKLTRAIPVNVKRVMYPFHKRVAGNVMVKIKDVSLACVVCIVRNLGADTLSMYLILWWPILHVLCVWITLLTLTQDVITAVHVVPPVGKKIPKVNNMLQTHAKFHAVFGKLSFRDQKPKINSVSGFSRNTTSTARS